MHIIEKSRIIQSGIMENYIRVYKALSDITRARILRLLLDADTELCICEIMDSLNLAQHRVSKHIKKLKNAGIVKGRRQGQFVSYSLMKNSDAFCGFLLESVRRIKNKTIVADNKRLVKMLKLKEDGCCIMGIKK